MSHEVQLVLIVEQVKQGERQPRQVDVTKNWAGSRQEMQIDAELQVAQGLTQERQLLVVLSP